jgi:hypothetical protein
MSQGNQQHESLEIDINLGTDDIKDWSGEGGFQPPEVPAGEYTLDVLAVKQETSKSKGNPMLVVTFAVSDGDYAGKELTGYYTLTQKALGRVKRLMMAVGARLDKIRTDEIVGGRLRATVIHQEAPPQRGPDGNVKCDPNTGEPYPPSIFAKVQNERMTEEAEKAAEATAAKNAKAIATGKNQAAVPPVTRTNASPATRRA